MNRNHHLLNIILFAITIVFFGVLSILLPKEVSVAENENRVLSQLPKLTKETLFSGEYFRAFDNYYADHFPFREAFVRSNSFIDRFKGLPDDENVQIVVFKGNNDSEKHNEEGEGELIFNANMGNIFVYNNRAMEIYTHSPESSLLYAETINDFMEQVGDEVKVYALIVPTAVEFIEGKYNQVSDPQKPAIKYVYDHLNEEVRKVDAYEVLEKHKEEYIYFRTDHHWTQLGAYYAYTAFMDMLGLLPIQLEDYQIHKLEGFLGTTYSATLNKQLEEQPDVLYYLEPFTKYEYTIYKGEALKSEVINLEFSISKNKYGIFLGGDQPLGKIQTQVKNGKKIVVIKDSYGNAFVPLLLPHYEEIYTIDARQFSGNIFDFIKEREIEDVLFLNYVQVLRFDGYANTLKEIMD